MLPVLLEEGVATIRGNKWAREALSTDLAKKVAKGNMYAYLSYLATAAALTLATVLARKVKDSLVAKKEEKLQTQN